MKKSFGFKGLLMLDLCLFVATLSAEAVPDSYREGGRVRQENTFYRHAVTKEAHAA